MAFSATQLRALRRDVDRRNLRTRQVQNGRQLTYIEGWHAVAEANRIFGFDGWDRETVESRCILAREIRGTFTAIYVARVRIKVRADGETIIREGHGTGESKAVNPGEAHDMAIKAAETDATKRALATFGKPFGLSLYLKGRARALPPKEEKTEREQRSPTRSPVNAASSPNQPPRNPVTCAPDHERRRTLQRLSPDGRYYVPPRAQPTSDSFHAILASEEANKDKIGGSGVVGAISVTQNPEEESAVNAASPADDRTKTSGALSENNRADIRATLSEETTFLIAHPRRTRDKDHLAFVAAQPCLLCGRTPSDPHHLRFAQPRALSRKVSDEFTVPLCRTHHRQLHHAGDEAGWWSDLDIDPLLIARELWSQTRGLKKDIIKKSELPNGDHVLSKIDESSQSGETNIK